MLDLQLRLNDLDFSSAFASFGSHLNDWSAAWPRLAEAVRSMAREQFATQGARGPSGIWPPLSREYAARKARLYPGKPLMRATDRLYDSLTASSADTVFDVSPRTLKVGTRLDYAAYHQSGGAHARRPRRAILDFSTEPAGPDSQTMLAPMISLLREAASGSRLGIEGREASSAAGTTGQSLRPLTLPAASLTDGM